jgi:DNA-binding NarL/FixJ family response regulator
VPIPDEAAALSVLVVDDHRVFTDALRVGLQVQPGVRCVAVAHSAGQAMARAAAVDVDVALVDLDLPDSHDLGLVEWLRQRYPHVRVVVLTAYVQPAVAERAIAAGAVAFLGKDGSLERILSAVRHADADHPMVDVDLHHDRGDRVELTQRELEVLRQLALGIDVGRIAGVLGISRFTARDYVKSILGKLGAHSQLGAVVTAEQLGLIRIRAGR